MGWSPFRPTGLTHHEPNASVKGYTLLTTLNADAAYLLDMSGQIVHRWFYPSIRAFTARLLANGNLAIMGCERSTPQPTIAPGEAPPFEVNIRRIGGNATHLWGLDWDGNVVWQYNNQAIHHDFVRLPNGHTLFPEFVELPAEVARQVKGGYPTKDKLPALISDDFIEIDASGNEVARAHLWQLLDPRRDPICPLEVRLEWTHTNSLDVTSEGDILFSCRTNSRVGIMERSGQKLLWKYGAPNTHHQHHASVLSNGNVQIFDNGMHRPGIPRSVVVEVNPKDNSVAWQYAANPEIQFFSANISGAERLAGGNVLITEGAPGRVFEITKTGEVVWEFVNPFSFKAANGSNASQVFRAHRYAYDHPALKGRELDPQRCKDLNRLYGLLA